MLNGELARMSERRIADIMCKAGSGDNRTQINIKFNRHTQQLLNLSSERPANARHFETVSKCVPTKSLPESGKTWVLSFSRRKLLEWMMRS